MRLPLDAFNSGVSMAQMPGTNPTADAIKGVIQRYKDLQAQKEQIAMAGALTKAKTMAEFDVKKSVIPTKPPDGYEPSGYDEYGFLKGYNQIDLRKKILKQVEEKGYESLSPNQKFLFDKVFKMEGRTSESDQAFKAISGGGGTDVQSLINEYNTTNDPNRLKEVEAILTQQGVTFQ